jgi:hypothetical protein
MHMILYPKDGSDIVLYCRAGDLKIYSRKARSVGKAQGGPLTTFSESEGAAIAWFLRYWHGDDRLAANAAGTPNGGFDCHQGLCGHPADRGRRAASAPY